MCVFMIKFQLFNSQNITYLYKLKLFKYVACTCALYLLLYITLTAFFCNVLIIVQLKPQPFIPYVRWGSIRVLYSNTLMRVGRTFFSLFNIPITLVHLFYTLFI